MSRSCSCCLEHWRSANVKEGALESTNAQVMNRNWSRSESYQVQDHIGNCYLQQRSPSVVALKEMSCFPQALCVSLWSAEFYLVTEQGSHRRSTPPSLFHHGSGNITEERTGKSTRRWSAVLWKTGLKSSFYWMKVTCSPPVWQVMTVKPPFLLSHMLWFEQQCPSKAQVVVLVEKVWDLWEEVWH